MAAPVNSADVFQTGGSLAADAPTYVERPADEALYQKIRAGEFCYVLNSRQMGKSSLRVRTMQRLMADGWACAAIDITRIGSQQVEAARWYAGLIRSLASSFDLTQRINLRDWLRQHEYLTPVQQLGEFIESVLLVEIASPMVIFVDEIDSVLGLNFPTDDLFTFIRACYNQRVDNPAYKRLTFVLLGVATPSDLVRDKTRTPFNIGSPVELSGLRFDRSQSLVTALTPALANPAEVLQQILHWTGGQPFLTQKLCRLVIEQSLPGATLSPEAVDAIVQAQVLENWEAQDDQDHLRTIQARMLQDQRKAGRLLGVYQQILQQGSVAYDGSPEHMELRLTGLVVAQQGQLQVYNQIYQRVFDTDWVNRALDRLRPYGETIVAWLASDCQDSSRLLRGQALGDAQAWAIGKSLSTQDYEFLAASRELDVQEMQVALLTQQEANKILAGANETLESANQKARRRLSTSFAGAGLAIALALLAGGWALRAVSRATMAQSALTETRQSMENAWAETDNAKQAEKEAKQAQTTAEKAVEAAVAERKQIEAQTEAERQQIEAKTRLAVVAANEQVGVAQRLSEQAKTEQAAASAAAATAQVAKTQAEDEREVALIDLDKTTKEISLALAGIDLERRGATLLRYQPERFTETEVLLEAMRLGQALRKLLLDSAGGNKSSNLASYPATSPVLSLRKAVNQVVKINQLQGSFHSISADAIAS